MCGTWRVERGNGSITLVIEPFAPPSRAARDGLIEEGERLLRFIDGGDGGDGGDDRKGSATVCDIRFAE